MSCAFDVMCHGLSGLEYREENIRAKKTLAKMGVVDATRAIGYHFLDKQGKVDDTKLDDLRKSLNDHLNPRDVLRHYRAADGTALLYLIHDALVKGLGAAIDSTPESEE